MNTLDKLNLSSFRNDIRDLDEEDENSVKEVFEKQKDFFEDINPENEEYKKSFLHNYISGDLNTIMDPYLKIERINKLSRVLELIRDNKEIDAITKDHQYNEWTRLIAEVILRDLEDNNGGLRPIDLGAIENREIINNLKDIVIEVNDYIKFSYGDEIYNDQDLNGVYIIEQNKKNLQDYFFSTIDTSNSDNMEKKKLMVFSMINGNFYGKGSYSPNSIQRVAIINQLTKILKEWKEDKTITNFNEKEYFEWKKIISEVVLRDIQDQWGGILKKDFSKIDPEIKNEICNIIQTKNSKIYEYISYIN